MKCVIQIIAAFFALSLASVAHGSCVTVSTSNVPVINYDPFSPTVPLQSFDIRLNKAACTGGATPTLTFWFRDDVPPTTNTHKLGGIALELRYNGSDYLASSGAPNAIPPRTFAISPGVTTSLGIDVALITSPIDQVKSDARDVSLYYSATDDGGQIQRIPLHIVLALTSSFALSANGSGNATLDFGVLAPGISRSIILTASGTTRFKIEMESLYGQALRRTANCGVALDRFDALESIAYQAQVGIRPISISTPYTDASPKDGEVFRRILPFTVMVDPTFLPGQRRAGNYCDIIKLKISAL